MIDFPFRPSPMIIDLCHKHDLTIEAGRIGEKGAEWYVAILVTWKGDNFGTFASKLSGLVNEEMLKYLIEYDMKEEERRRGRYRR
ncbi:hypothetical protein AbraIFM66951_007945 [Aspergillus brasiliensis]|uniref:Uncharacterized protein n=1 Tax=Aspergillus brasiliensis TaxID=319629 RepID=A0A9W6DPH5_9EURO|nr:hypothetical protein AbraCBS73388_008451 [Aspergillus brasiliensis]GKZ45328.1 hypothetical protein AbraIFM66951_007945 [Aspergillus brasiliensis]